MSNCDACSTRQLSKLSRIPDHSHDRLFTFGIEYRHGEDVSYEEIDIRAGSRDEAVALATTTAEEGYMAGYTDIVEMSPGGSGGLITIY